MTQKQANDLMAERFEELLKGESENLTEKTLASECALKIFITLTNAGAFDGGNVNAGGGMLN